MDAEMGEISPGYEKVIFIIDDEAEIGEILQKAIMQQTNYQVLWMGDTDAVLRAAPYLHPSLILLDYMLPQMNGLDLFDCLQANEHLRNVPVILMSGRESIPFEALRDRGIYLLKKPFELTDLLDMLAHLLTK